MNYDMKAFVIFFFSTLSLFSAFKGHCQPDSVIVIKIQELNRQIVEQRARIYSDSLAIEKYKGLLAEATAKLEEYRALLAEMEKDLAVLENDALRRSMEVFGIIDGAEKKLSLGNVYKAKKINSIVVKVDGAAIDKRTIRVVLFDITRDRNILGDGREIQMVAGTTSCSFTTKGLLDKGNYFVRIYAAEKLIHEYPFSLR